MATHSDETPHTCSTCGKSFKTKDTLAKHHMKTHSKILLLQNKVMPESVGKEANDSKDISSGFESHQSIAVDERVQDVGLPKCRSVLNERKCPGLHSSGFPFIMNIKQEEDI